MIRLIAILIVIVSLSGCATYVSNVRPNYVPTTSALVVFSTRVDDNCGGALATLSLNFEYLNEGNTEKGYVLLKNGLLSSEFKDTGGFFFISEWPAAEYIFTNVNYSSTKAGVVSTKSTYEVKATLEAGKVYYLGEFYSKLPNCREVIIGVNNEYQRDSVIFDSKMKNLKSASFIQGVLPTGIWRPK